MKNNFFFSILLSEKLLFLFPSSAYFVNMSQNS